ncbi:DUF3237 domain-containing protein [Actinocorallia sp. A-T 12471]|uniref:DUF3237 domain-containing protein n=1 Tax=Actinocorallia sp. A-T 12471 TaxID=3089813 RepID=UPI0029CE93E4|nr:DUF3237 domain-containing protein [Actinocorallia sp. A-T 12471]MDX6741377.1 DUF3237 domain-containing protein [Actinocorallia sp. A-T 12471]
MTDVPALRFAFEIHVDLAPTLHIGHGTGERTEFTPITGGKVTGPLLNGAVLPGGGDWSSTRGTVCELDARYLLQADDGAVIDIANRGYYHEDDPTAPAQQDGPLKTSAPGVYYRTSPVFRTDAAPHLWLTRMVFVGLARDAGPHAIAIRMYALL